PNRKRWLSSYSLHVREHRSPTPCGESYLPTVPATGAAAQPALLRCDRRGIYQFHGVAVYTRFPFSLFIHFARFKDAAELVVHPPIGRLTQDALSLIARGRGNSNQPQTGSGGQDEFFGLREYRQGDNPRWIHWKRSARIGTLLVREMSPLVPRRVVIMLSACQPEGKGFVRPRRGIAVDDRLEKALALATSLINDAIHQGLEVGLLIAAGEVADEQRWFPPSRGRRLWEPMMRAMASLTPTHEPAARLAHDSLRHLAHSQCLWITSGLSSDDVQGQVAALAEWNIAVQPLIVERTDLDRLLVLPPAAGS
ncbi:MAG: DUF58 domain-containing protein, partial [Phycisphaerae bacterium]|nr:DUF58 domain-containing protein [Phycisphaerae bacterium]